MKWLADNKIYLAIVLFGLTIIITGINLLRTPAHVCPPTQIVPYTNETVVIGLTDADIAKLEAAESKSTALEVEIHSLTLENKNLQQMLSQAVAKNIQLMGNQNPNLEKHYQDLKYRYEKQTIQLNNLEETYNKLNFEYEVLVNVHAKCGEED